MDWRQTVRGIIAGPVARAGSSEVFREASRSPGGICAGIQSGEFDVEAGASGPERSGSSDDRSGSSWKGAGGARCQSAGINDCRAVAVRS